MVTDATVTIDVVKTSLAGAGERAVGISTGGSFNAIMGKNISASAFVDVFTDIVTVSWFLVTSVAVAVVATVIISASGEIRALGSSSCTFVDVKTAVTTTHEANTIAIIPGRTGAFKAKVNIGTRGKCITMMLTKSAFVFLNALNAVTFGTFSGDLSKNIPNHSS